MFIFATYIVTTFNNPSKKIWILFVFKAIGWRLWYQNIILICHSYGKLCKNIMYIFLHGHFAFQIMLPRGRKRCNPVWYKMLLGLFCYIFCMIIYIIMYLGLHYIFTIMFTNFSIAYLDTEFIVWRVGFMATFWATLEITILLSYFPWYFGQITSNSLIKLL